MAERYKRAKDSCERVRRRLQKHCTTGQALRDEERLETDPSRRIDIQRHMKEIKPTIEDIIIEFERQISTHDGIIDDLAEDATEDQRNNSDALWDGRDAARMLTNGLQVDIDMIKAEQSRGQAGQDQGSQNPVQQALGHAPIQNKVRLPQLELKRFKGDKCQWQAFWDIFESTIHRNNALQAVDKMSYLVSLLDNEPHRIVSTLPLTNDNYQVAIGILEEYYGNQQAVVEDIYTKVMNLRPPTIETKKLREFHVEVDMNLRRLETLGEAIADNQWVVMIKSKLPKSVVFNLERKKDSNEKWTVQTLKKALMDEINTRESVEGIDRNNAAYKPYNQSTFNPDERSTAMAAENKASDVRKYNCAFCNGEHYSDKCEKVRNVDLRLNKLRQSKLCFRCLKPGHLTQACRNTKPCYYCKGNHNQSLCHSAYGGSTGNRVQYQPRPWNKGKAETAFIGTDNETTSSDWRSCQNDQAAEREQGLLAVGENGILQMAKANLSKPGSTNTTPAVVLLDGGCSRTYITTKVARTMNLKLRNSDPLEINRFLGDSRPVTIKAKTAVIDVITRGERRSLDVTVVDKLADPIMKIPIPKNLLSRFGSLRMADINPSQREDREIDILIGGDYYFDFVTGEKILIQEGLYLVGSDLGWIVAGRLKTAFPRTSQLFVQTRKHEDVLSVRDPALDDSPDLATDFNKLSDLETIGIKDSPYADDDEMQWNRFKETVKFEDGRYHVKWPLKDHAATLPTNFGLAIGRLRHLIRRLEAKPELFDKYKKIIRDQLDNGVIEKVNDDEVRKNHDSTTPKHPIHYISHHPVETPQKTTTKVRIVYDASARQGKRESLNDVLYRGAVILEDLAGLLLRFRLREVGIVADIQKAFLQVGLQAEDRDLTRFLWLKDDTKPLSDDNIQVFRFCRVPFGMRASMFLLGATIQYHLESIDSPSAAIIRENDYVDNVIASIDGVQNAKRFYTEAKSIFASAGMNLREWLSSDDEVMNTIPEDDRVKQRTTKVLGVTWDSKRDVMKFDLEYASDTAHITRRMMLRQVSKIFDPLGYLCPIILPLKLFMQARTTKNTKWDEALSDDIRTEWEKIAKKTLDVTVIELPRFIGSTLQQGILCCFVDASQKAYAACVYLRLQCKGNVVVELMLAKSRLVPTKPVTTPRLELLAAVIGARMIEFVRKELRLGSLPAILWSDSMCVLHWIKSTKEFSVFIQNRVNEVRKLEEVEFRYVLTTDNPADLATRGVAASMLPTAWWHGPAWLSLPPSKWPDFARSIFASEEDQVNKELRMKQDALLSTDAAMEKRSAPVDVNLTNFRSVTKLWRVTAMVLKAIRKMKKKDAGNGSMLKQSEVRHAKVLWEKFFQRCSFKEVCEDLTSRHVHKKAIIGQLGLFEDEDGVIRCYSRYTNVQADADAKFPVLLPKQSPYTDLLVREYHERLLHGSPSQTLAEVRESYWIPSGRSAVKKVISACPGCKRFTAQPFKLPLMPPLPRCRVTRDRPFKYTGLDYFGPFTIKWPDKKCESKVWVCLFTCLVVRAVHAELVSDMTTASFLSAIRRFRAKFGKPATIICDNAPQFKLGCQALSDALKSTASDGNVEWKFIPEYCPWAGGVYERMVGILKKAFTRGIGKSKLNYDQMQTLLAEAVSVVNRRPLTYVEDEITTVLSPDHLLGLVKEPLIGIPDAAESDPDYHPAETTRTELVALWKKSQHLLDHFWKVWERQYLLALRERTPWMHKNKRCAVQRSPKIGEVVLLNDPLRARADWQLGRITSLDVSSDGAIRSAKCLLTNGRVTTRSVGHLYSLEVPEEESSRSPQDPEDNPENNNHNESPKVKRKAATDARKRIQDILDQEEDV